MSKNCTYTRCRLAPPGEYNWTIRARRRCGLMSNYSGHLSLLRISKEIRYINHSHSWSWRREKSGVQDDTYFGGAVNVVDAEDRTEPVEQNFGERWHQLRSSYQHVNGRRPARKHTAYISSSMPSSHVKCPHCVCVTVWASAQSCPWVHFVWPNPTHYKWKKLDPTRPNPILTVTG